MKEEAATILAEQQETKNGFLNQMHLEIKLFAENIKVLMSNTNYNSKKVQSLRKFIKDEECGLKVRIGLLFKHYEHQLAFLEKNAVCESSPLHPTYLRLQRELVAEMENIIQSEVAIYKKQVAQFMLLLEV